MKKARQQGQQGLGAIELKKGADPAKSDGGGGPPAGLATNLCRELQS
jgi:hypothetical protein